MKRRTAPTIPLISVQKVMPLAAATPTTDSGPCLRIANRVVMFHFVSSIAQCALLSTVFLKPSVELLLLICATKEMLLVVVRVILHSGAQNLPVLLAVIV